MKWLDRRGLGVRGRGSAKGKPERNPEISREPLIVYKLGRQLSELSTLCLFTYPVGLAGDMVESRALPPPVQ